MKHMIWMAPLAALVALALAACGQSGGGEATAKPSAAAAAPAKPALTVTAVHAEQSRLPLRLGANGNIAAWQEASIGAEANGLRLAEVRVNIGDKVKKGEVLAVFAADSVRADVTQARAALAEGEASAAEAAANADRARQLKESNALSAQQINQYLTAETVARARVASLRATVDAQRLRLAQTQVRASDDGVISARSATVGAVVPAGSELFRMIRQGRLEWRAEVPASDLARLQPGLAARVTAASGAPIEGKVRMVAPMVNAQTRNGIVYVDLTPSAEARAGMFARGEFEIGSAQGLTLPQSAVLLRDGFNYVLRVAPDSKLSEVKVSVGQRIGDRIEITGGLDAEAQVVASGGGFLADGDTVRVVEAPPAGNKLALTPALSQGSQGEREKTQEKTR